MPTNRINEYKVIIQKHISKAIQEIANSDDDLGYVPENIEVAMTDAAYAVLYATSGLNEYLEKEGLLKR